MTEPWKEKITPVVSILTLGAGLLAMFAGVENWWVVFVIGWAVVTPLSGILFDDDTEVGTSGTDVVNAGKDTDTQDALETLRDRYARGELTEEQFERKVERLLETETVEDARDRVASGERERAENLVSERESGRGR